MDSKTLRKRVAEAALEMAMECVNGTAPESIGRLRLKASDGTRCAIGRIYWMAAPLRDPYIVQGLIDAPDDIEWLVIEANDKSEYHADRMERLVFPLLAYADAIEAAP